MDLELKRFLLELLSILSFDFVTWFLACGKEALAYVLLEVGLHGFVLSCMKVLSLFLASTSENLGLLMVMW